MSAFVDNLIAFFYAHKDHDTFVPDDEPIRRVLGFTCFGCHDLPLGTPLGYQIDLVTYGALRLQQPQFFRDVEFWRHRVVESYRKKEREAEQTALRLLLRHLTRQQRRELKHLKAFFVSGADGRRYRIDLASHTNVAIEEDGRDLVRYCAIFSFFGVPVYDLMLAQKLLLETSPEEFHKVANVIPIVRDRDIPLFDRATGTIIEGRLPDFGEPVANVRGLGRLDTDEQQAWLRARGFELRNVGNDENGAPILALERTEDNERRDQIAEERAAAG